MIYLTKGQPLFSNEGMVVCAPTGYYEDGSSVACAMFHSVEEPVCLYEAKFIAYGEQVYNIVDENKLMEEIKKIDPESLLGKTNADVIVDNLVQDIKTVENPTPELTPESIKEVEPNPVIEKVETVTETYENGETSTVTKTTTIEENTTVIDTTTNPDPVVIPDTTVVPEVITPDPVVTPDPIITPEVIVNPDVIVTPDTNQLLDSVVDKPVSILRSKISKRKIV